MTTLLPDLPPTSPEEAFEAAYQLVTENDELFEQFVARGGLSLLREGTYVLTLIDPHDPLGRAAIRLFGLPGGEVNKFDARVFALAGEGATPRIRQAATKALACMEIRLSMALAPVLRTALPGPIQEDLDTPGPFGTFPVLVIARSCSTLLAWTPSREAGRS